MGFLSFKPKVITYILVELVDMDSHGDVTQLHKTPLDAIPEQLPVGATITFGPKSWTIQETDPATRAEAGETGHLRLVVRRTSAGEEEEHEEQAAPPTTYPTVCAVLPALSDQTKIETQCYQLNVSDWRQIEFVSRSLTAEIDRSLAGVRSIIDGNEVEGGYAVHYMRDLVPNPLGTVALPIEEVTTIFADGCADLGGVAIFGRRNLIDGSFAFRTGSLTEIYGYQVDGVVQALCIGGIGTYEYDSPEVQAIADFCAERDYCLIDWPAASKLDPENEDFFAFFDPPTDFEEVYQEAPL